MGKGDEMMDEKIQQECIAIIGGFAIVALVMKQPEMALVCITALIAFLSPKGVQTVQNAVASEDTAKDTEQATSDEQATPVTTDDLAAQTVDTTTSTTDTTQPIVATPATDVQSVQQVTLSQESVNAIAAAMNQQNQTAQTNDANAAVATDVQPVNQQ